MCRTRFIFISRGRQQRRRRRRILFAGIFAPRFIALSLSRANGTNNLITGNNYRNVPLGAPSHKSRYRRVVCAALAKRAAIFFFSVPFENRRPPPPVCFYAFIITRSFGFPTINRRPRSIRPTYSFGGGGATIQTVRGGKNRIRLRVIEFRLLRSSVRSTHTRGEAFVQRGARTYRED